MLRSKGLLPPDTYGLLRISCSHNPENMNSKILRIHKNHRQADGLSICIQSPVAAVDTVPHSTGKKDCSVAAFWKLPFQKACALILKLRMCLAAFLKKSGKIIKIFVLPRIFLLPLFKKYPVLFRKRTVCKTGQSRIHPEEG